MFGVKSVTKSSIPVSNKKSLYTWENTWFIIRILTLAVVLTIFLPTLYFQSIHIYQGYILSTLNLLIGNHGLDAAFAQGNVYPVPIIQFGVALAVINIALAWLSKKAVFWTMPISLLSTLSIVFGSSMCAWLVRSGSSFLFGYHIFIALQIAIMLLSFVAIILKRVRVETGSFKSHLALFGMLTPGILYLLIFAYLPMPGIMIAFKRYQVFGRNVLENFYRSEWVGLENLRFLFATPDAWQITRNTVLYNITFMILGLIFSVGLAIAISLFTHRKLAKLYQTIFFLPFFLSWMVVGYLGFAMLNFDLGFLNQILGFFGAEPIDWYMRSEYWPLIFIFFNLWKYTGNGSIIYIATIAGFDTEIFEAASIDGASKWKQIRYLTIPMLVPMMTLLTILGIGRMFNADLGMFLSLPMGSGPLRPVSNVIDLYVFNSLRGGVNFGLPAAAALYQSVVGFILVLTTNTIVRKINPDNALF